MLNREYSVDKRSYADFSIETLLRKDYCQERGTVRQIDNSSKIKENNLGGIEWSTTRNICGNHELIREVDNQLIDSDQDQVEAIINVEDGDTVDVEGNNSKLDNFPWLSCTRFKPPKLTRSRRKSSGSKRNCGRGPRIPFSSHQLALLERTFKNSQYLSSKAISNLAESLQLTEVRVKIWFQNRRARYRRESDGTLSPSKFPGRASQAPALFSFKDQEGPCINSIKMETATVPIVSSKNNIITFPETHVSSKQSFRHLVNDLNLMTANANAPTSSNFSSCFKAYFSHFPGSSTSNISLKDSFV